ncbi:MAG: GNAT family N-acetyltransferase [Acidimicrobiia bacterium]|nr:GNAT family N-acetyltransferase [Acidimicrobiia bacterium]
MDLEIRPATADHVEEFVAWRYEAPYDVYDITDPLPSAVDYFLRENVACHAIVSSQELVGFCTFGSDAQVPGGDYGEDALDIGLGVRPDLTGKGLGRVVIGAVVDLARNRAGGSMLRVTIAAANERALRAWRSAGFSDESRFESLKPILGSDEFLILTR